MTMTEHETVADWQVSTRYNLTDVGNAERLIHRHGLNLRHCRLWGRWLVWDERRWRVDDTGRAEMLAQETVRAILAEALDLDGDDRKKLVSHAFASERAARIRGLLEMAEVRDMIPVRPDKLDPDPWTLNVQNGTLDLRTLDLRPHRREDGITKLAPVDYQPDAKAPRWTQFLTEIFAGDDDLISFVRRAAGYSLTGDTREQVFFLCFGSGSNGKSTFLETIQHLLGDYSLQTTADTLLVRNYQGVPNDVARLKGARYVTAIESPEGARLNEVLLKQLTGGDTVSARFMRAEWFDFEPTLKLWLGTNHKPTIRGTDHAIWRRVRLIPFTRTFDEKDRDPDLRMKLLEELPGILCWALEGLRDWHYEGLGAPAAVTDATTEYRREEDVLAQFLADVCVVHFEARVKTADLYRAYAEWAAANGERPRSQTAVGRALSERGFTQYRSHGGRQWSGLRLQDEGDLFTAAQPAA